MLDGDDARFQQARETWNQLVQSPERLLTHSYVLIEMMSLVQRRLGLAALRDVQDNMMPALEVHWITETEHRLAVEMVLTAGRRQLSVVDCASFVVMRERGIRDAFAFDDHFREQGFRTLPE